MGSPKASCTGSFSRALLIAAAALLASSCSRRAEQAPSPGASAAPETAKAKPFVVGFIYVGSKSDYGYNQAHAEGAAAVAKMPGVVVREEENVPETLAVQKTMESM
ncbi:MAG: hypothetical protein ACREJ3_15810, partial [Polyangiaceae bacterium]